MHFTVSKNSMYDIKEQYILFQFNSLSPWKLLFSSRLFSVIDLQLLINWNILSGWFNDNIVSKNVEMKSTNWNGLQCYGSRGKIWTKLPVLLAIAYYGLWDDWKYWSNLIKLLKRNEAKLWYNKSVWFMYCTYFNLFTWVIFGYFFAIVIVHRFISIPIKAEGLLFPLHFEAKATCSYGNRSYFSTIHCGTGKHR